MVGQEDQISKKANALPGGTVPEKASEFPDMPAILTVVGYGKCLPRFHAYLL